MNRMQSIAAAIMLAAAPTVVAGPVNVNEADAQTLARELKGIGLDKAGAIVAYREKHGPFSSIAELAQVKGIGVRTLELNQHDIRLDDGEPEG